MVAVKPCVGKIVAGGGPPRCWSSKLVAAFSSIITYRSKNFVDNTRPAIGFEHTRVHHPESTKHDAAVDILCEQNQTYCPLRLSWHADQAVFNARALISQQRFTVV